MDNYIVRILRHDLRDPEKIAGLVEIVTADEQRPSADATTSGEILGLTKSGKERAKKKTARTKQ